MKEVVLTLYGAISRDFKINFEDDVAEAILTEFRRFFRSTREISNGELLNAFISLIIEKHAQQRETTETITQKMTHFNEMFKSVKPRDKGAALFVANKQSGELVSTDEASGISVSGANGGGSNVGGAGAGTGAGTNSNLDGAAAKNGGENGADLAGAGAGECAGENFGEAVVGAGENLSDANIDLDGAQISQVAGALAPDFPVSQGALGAATSSAMRPSYTYYKSKFYDENGRALKREIKVNDEILRSENPAKNADGECDESVADGADGAANSNLTHNAQETADVANATDATDVVDVADVAKTADEVKAAETSAKVAAAEVSAEKTPAQSKEKPAQKTEQKFAGFGRFRRQK